MPPFDSQDWAISKIRSVRHLLWDVPEAALKNYNAIPHAFRVPWTPRATADVLNSYVLDEAKRRFEGVRGSDFFPKNGTTYQTFRGAVFWYKQLGVDGLPSNYPTPTAEEMMQGTFPFARQKPLLVLGFKVDETMQNIKSVVIQRFNSLGKLRYFIELEKVATAKARVYQMSSQSNDGVATRTGIKIRRGPEQNELLAQENE